MPLEDGDVGFECIGESRGNLRTFRVKLRENDGGGDLLLDRVAVENLQDLRDFAHGKQARANLRDGPAASS
jgi:hypothetical protein